MGVVSLHLSDMDLLLSSGKHNRIASLPPSIIFTTLLELTFSTHEPPDSSPSPYVKYISLQTFCNSCLSAFISAWVYCTPGNTSDRRLNRSGMSSATSLGTMVSQTLWIKICWQNHKHIAEVASCVFHSQSFLTYVTQNSKVIIFSVSIIIQSNISLKSLYIFIDQVTVFLSLYSSHLLFW